MIYESFAVVVQIQSMKSLVLYGLGSQIAIFYESFTDAASKTQ